MMLLFPESSPLQQALSACCCFLKQSNVDSPGLSAHLLVAHVLGLDRTGLIMQHKRMLTTDESQNIHKLIIRRATGEPVAYLLKEKEFFGLSFKVSPAVLVPRPETEHIIEHVQKLYSTHDTFSFADFGTGSGALAVTLAVLFPKAQGLALDLSQDALAVAHDNASRHNVLNRIQFANADFAAPPCPDGTLDLIVSNPPYISSQEYDELSKEVRNFEPQQALVPNKAPGPDDMQVKDGLEAARALMPAACACLRNEGHLLIEHGYAQGPSMRALFRESRCFYRETTLQDLAGLDRITFAVKKTTV